MEDMKLAKCLFTVLFCILIAMVLPLSAQTKTKIEDKYLMYVGTYSQRDSKGIYVYRYELASGLVTPLGVAAESKDPSFLAIHPNHKFLYAVNESSYKGQTSGGLSAFSINADTGKLTPLNDVASRGADPCHLSIDRTGKYVLVANYTGGNVAVFPLLEDGRIGESSAFDQHKGTGPNASRQEAPHAHWIDLSPDNRFVLNADLGLDEIVVYRFDAGNGSLSPNDPPFAKVEPGAGPRHVAFHPNGKFVYVINELNSTVTTFSFDGKAGTLITLGVVPTLPASFKDENSPAEIVVHPSGKFVYASNRGHDSIAVFKVDPRKGTLTFVAHTPTQGKAPRNFEIDPAGKRMFVANHQSDNIVVFNIDPISGKLAPTGQEFKVSAPVCIRFMAQK